MIAQKYHWILAVQVYMVQIDHFMPVERFKYSDYNRSDEIFLYSDKPFTYGFVLDTIQCIHRSFFPSFLLFSIVRPSIAGMLTMIIIMA